MSPRHATRCADARIGYIFQGFNLIPYLTVEENIPLPCELHSDAAGSHYVSDAGE